MKQEAMVETTHPGNSAIPGQSWSLVPNHRRPWCATFRSATIELMASTKNRRVVLAARPKGEPKDTDFRLEEAEVPSPEEGQVLLRTLYLSLDPYMRGRMNAGPSYAAPVEIDEVMEGGTVSEVVESKSHSL